MFLSTGFSLWMHDVSPKQNLVYLLKNFKHTHTHTHTHTQSLLRTVMVPSLFGTRDQFCEDSFSVDGGVDGSWMIQVHYIYCALSFYFYCISST